jgi:phosphatidylserine/phosphatidylglycerophosphate/cardiolipin synthase-like enzyme
MGERMPGEECKPEYWFLDLLDQPIVTLRETGKKTSIAPQRLLPERNQWWSELASKVWNLQSSGESVVQKAYTSNNLVTPLVDGEAYMGNLYANLGDLKQQEFVLLAGWEFKSDQPLDPYDKLNTKLLDQLKKAVVKNGIVRMLAWDSTVPFVGNKEMVEALGKVAGTGTAYLVPNEGGSFLSHHQKEVVIGKNDWKDSCAYVGGIDLAPDRWDDGEHKKKVKEANFIGWHDIQVKVQGDAVLQLWANFAERWFNGAQSLKKAGQPQPASCPVPQFRATLPGSHHVQVLRTVTHVSSKFPERTMPNGERTVLCALQKAISKAEHYIYIEEQFLWDCELADFIARRMGEKPQLRLIVVLAAGTELPLQYGEWHYHQRSKFFMTVMGKRNKAEIEFGRKTRVYAFGLFPIEKVGQPVYVHSKLMIIDDRFVSIGSANFDARSMFVDTELTVGVVDSVLVDGDLSDERQKVCKFARDLRVRLWKEHLNVQDLGTYDFDSALDMFPGVWGNSWPLSKQDAKNKQKHHIRCYINEPGADKLTNATARILDRNERHW